MKKDYIKPVVVLLSICLVMTAVLALVYSITKPVIAEGISRRTQEAMEEIVPGGVFEEVTANYSPPTGVSIKSIIRASSSGSAAGYIVNLGATGKNGADSITFLALISTEGKVLKTVTLANTDTKGFGDTAVEFMDTQIASNETAGGIDPQTIDAFTGATITSKAYKSALSAAVSAILSIEGGEG